jgi:hypothetical protein
MRGTHAWQDDIYRIVSEYLDDVPERTGPVDWDDKIDEFGFESVESLEIRVQRSWTPDEIVVPVVAVVLLPEGLWRPASGVRGSSP